MTTARRALPITCPRYEAVEGTKRCRHYETNGACRLPDQFMCVEWLKANDAPAKSDALPANETARDLFGRPLVEPPPPARSAETTRRSPPVSRHEEAPRVRTPSDADIASFKALDLEARVQTDDLGELWIVPAYTGADRQELSVDHAALLATLCSSLAGARLTALVRKPKRTSV